MSVNAAPMVFFFVLPFTVAWGTLEAEAFHALGNERTDDGLVRTSLVNPSLRMAPFHKNNPLHDTGTSALLLILAHSDDSGSPMHVETSKTNQ